MGFSPPGRFPLAEPSSLSGPVTFVTFDGTGATPSELEAKPSNRRLQGFALYEDSTSSVQG
jgi:hypothetical protein